MNNEIVHEARRLHRDLIQLRIRGQRLLKTQVSAESANHFVELSNLHMRGLRDALGFESHVEPVEQIHVALEGIGNLLSKISAFFKSNKKVASVGKKESAEDKLKFLKSLEDKSSRSARHVAVDKVTIGKANGGLFVLNGKVVDNPLEAISKQLDEYRTLFSRLKAPCLKYNKWASDTWDGVEKEFEKLGNDADDYGAVIAFVKKQVKVRPAVPSETLSISDQARLGYPSPDRWIADSPTTLKGQSNPIFIPKFKSEIKVEASQSPIGVDETDKALRLYSSAMDLWDEVYEVKDVMGGTGDFTDYPYRNDVFTDQLFDQCTGDELSYDSETVNDLANPFYQMEYRIDELMGALYALIRASYN